MRDYSFFLSFNINLPIPIEKRANWIFLIHKDVLLSLSIFSKYTPANPLNIQAIKTESKPINELCSLWFEDFSFEEGLLPSCANWTKTTPNYTYKREKGALKKEKH